MYQIYINKFDRFSFNIKEKIGGGNGGGIYCFYSKRLFEINLFIENKKKLKGKLINQYYYTIDKPNILHGCLFIVQDIKILVYCVQKAKTRLYCQSRR